MFYELKSKKVKIYFSKPGGASNTIYQRGGFLVLFIKTYLGAYRRAYSETSVSTKILK
jgi:hypothetical protein